MAALFFQFRFEKSVFDLRLRCSEAHLGLQILQVATFKVILPENTVKLRYNEIHGDREKFRCSENFVVAEKSVNKENRAGV